MLKEHLESHGQTFRQHFKNNWYFTRLALKAAFFTFGHGVTPLISGRRASELHNELWDEGRKLSIEDITHRLNAGLYSNRAEAMQDYYDHAKLYNEAPLLGPFVEFIDQHYGKSK